MAQSLAPAGLEQTTDRINKAGRETPLAAKPRPAPPEQLPRQFGRYELKRLLGRGAMGTVYLAHDAQLDRLVALKIPRPLEEDPTAWRERFLSEARAAATLQHPNICPVHEVGEVEGQPYLTMAYIEGETLAARLHRAGCLPIPEAVELVRTICRAMAEAHDRGIIHRDLKPANIMLDRRGQPVIMDFGLALRPTAEDDLRLTLSGVALGTPCYMPPEQAGGDLEAIGPTADVYSLGVILFELVTGQVPFQGRTFGKLLAQIERDPPPPPQDINPAVDERLASVILRALAKTPDERFASAAALAEALDAWLAGAPSPAGPVRGPLAETADWKDGRAPVAARGLAADRGIHTRRWLVGGAAMIAAGLLGVLLYVATDYGTLVVELSDPAAQVDVKVNGKEVILDPDGNAVRIRAGKGQRLEISGSDYETTGESFDLKRGGNRVVRVTLVPKGRGPRVASRPALPPAPAEPAKPAKPPPPPVKFPGLIELPGWHVVAGATQEQMQAWLDERKRDQHSVMWLDAALVGDEPVFTGVAALDARANDWQAFLDLTERQVNDVPTLIDERGVDATTYLVVSIGGFVKDKSMTGVALYRRGKADGLAGIPNMFNAKLNMTLAVTRGFVARVLRPVVTPGGSLYCAMYAEGAIDTKSRHGFEFSEASLLEALETQRAESAYPLSVVPYDANGQRLYAATFLEDPDKAAWELLRDLTGDELKVKAAELVKKGLSPVSITVYPTDGTARYLTVWRQESAAAPAAQEE